MALVVDLDQRFTCRQCGRCCRRGWDIVVTPQEAEVYRQAGVGRLFREDADGPEGTERDPLEPIPGHASFSRIRKRSDGACGFLSPDNRCRIHEELGGERKPLACRVFPFRFDPVASSTVVSASFSCPTIVAGVGTRVRDQTPGLRGLADEWLRSYPAPLAEPSLVQGRSLRPTTLKTVRSVLRRLLDRPGDDAPDLGTNVARMAHWLDDLSRYRVVRLADDAFAEYVEIMGRYVVESDKPPLIRPPSRLSGLLFRGFLFTVLATQARLRQRSPGLRLALRFRVARLLLLTHGLGPRVGELSLARARQVDWPLGDADLAGISYRYLRSSVETLGSGSLPVLDELAVRVALLNAAIVLAKMKAAAQGRPRVEGPHLSEGLAEAADVAHLDPRLAPRLASFAAGCESLFRFAAGAKI